MGRATATAIGPVAACRGRPRPRYPLVDRRRRDVSRGHRPSALSERLSVGRGRTHRLQRSAFCQETRTGLVGAGSGSTQGAGCSVWTGSFSPVTTATSARRGPSKATAASSKMCAAPKPGSSAATGSLSTTLVQPFIDGCDEEGRLVADRELVVPRGRARCLFRRLMPHSTTCLAL